MEQFIVIELHDAFEFDSLVTSHPIYAPVKSPDEINEIFDGISYSKVEHRKIVINFQISYVIERRKKSDISKQLTNQ